MRFDVIHRKRIDLRLGIDCLHQFNLRDHVGNGETFRRVTVLIHGRTTHAGIDRVPIGEGLAKRLQDDNAYAFTADISVGRCVKGLTILVRTQKSGFGQHDGRFRTQHQIDAAGNRQVGFAAPQASAGQVHRYERT